MWRAGTTASDHAFPADVGRLLDTWSTSTVALDWRNNKQATKRQNSSKIESTTQTFSLNDGQTKSDELEPSTHEAQTRALLSCTRGLHPARACCSSCKLHIPRRSRHHHPGRRTPPSTLDEPQNAQKGLQAVQGNYASLERTRYGALIALLRCHARAGWVSQ